METPIVDFLNRPPLLAGEQNKHLLYKDFKERLLAASPALSPEDYQRAIKIFCDELEY